MFQFHEGPIKTPDAYICDNATKSFQFHEGPIKTVHSGGYSRTRPMFQFHEGPIKTCATSAAHTMIQLFQFHEGPIKTLTNHLPTSVLSGFNSMKVRLKPIAFFSKIPLYTRGIIIQRYKNSSRKYVDVE